MYLKRNQFLLSLILLPLVSFTQIEKGMSSFSGNIRIIQYDVQNYFNDDFLDLAVQPQYGHAIGKHWVVGGQATLNNHILDKSPYAWINNRKTTYSVAPFVQFIINPTAKWNVFGEVGLDFLNTTYSSNDNSINTLNYTIGLGLNKFINSEIAVQTKLNYFNKEVDYGQNERIGFYLFNLNLVNFIDLKSKIDENFGYLNRGRQILNVNMNGVTRSFNNGELETKVDYGYFIYKNLLLGYRNNTTFKEGGEIESTLYAQYFYRIGKRFNVFCKVESPFYPSDNKSDLIGFNAITVNSGLSYFLSKNVMLESVLVSFFDGIDRKSFWRFGPNISVKQFIK
jgi:Outer membrane protein beta-barrel domain